MTTLCLYDCVFVFQPVCTPVVTTLKTFIPEVEEKTFKKYENRIAHEERGGFNSPAAPRPKTVATPENRLYPRERTPPPVAPLETCD